MKKLQFQSSKKRVLQKWWFNVHHMLAYSHNAGIWMGENKDLEITISPNEVIIRRKEETSE